MSNFLEEILKPACLKISPTSNLGPDLLSKFGLIFKINLLCKLSHRKKALKFFFKFLRVVITKFHENCHLCSSAKLKLYYIKILNSDSLGVQQTCTRRNLIKDRQNSLSPSKVTNSRLMGAGDIGSTTDDSSSAIRTVISNHPPTAHSLTPNRHTPYSSPTPRLKFF